MPLFHEPPSTLRVCQLVTVGFHPLAMPRKVPRMLVTNCVFQETPDPECYTFGKPFEAVLAQFRNISVRSRAAAMFQFTKSGGC